MSAQTKNKKRTTETVIRPLTQTGDLLTEDDVKLLKRRETIKAELKRLDTHLKPRITETIDIRGTGLVLIGNKQVELKRSIRASVSWKPLLYSIIDESTIDAVKDDYSNETNIDSCKAVV